MDGDKEEEDVRSDLTEPQEELSAEIGEEQTDEAFVEGYDPFREVRGLTQKGEYVLAHEKLDEFEERGAEWHFVKSQIFRKQNWFSECRMSLTTAIALDPQNEEYKKELEELEKMAKSGKKARKKKERIRTGAKGDTASVCAEGLCECCGVFACEGCCAALDGC